MDSIKATCLARPQPLRCFSRVEIEGQVNTWPSIFSCDPSPVYTSGSPQLHRSEITSRVGYVLCVPLPIRGGYRLQTLQYPLTDGSRVEMQPNIEYDQTFRGSACPSLRA